MFALKRESFEGRMINKVCFIRNMKKKDFASADATRAFRKETHAHRGRCTGSRTARDSALDLR